MPAPVSPEVRGAIVRARRELKLSYEQIAELLDIGRATVNRVLRLERERGSTAPQPPKGGNFSPIVGRIADLLSQIVTSAPDATIDELTEALISRSGIKTSASSVGRALQRLGYSRKKSRSWRRSGSRPSTRRGAARSARS